MTRSLQGRAPFSRKPPGCTYRVGETWLKPAFADDIITKNTSVLGPARALVVLITNDAALPELEGE